MATPSPCSNRKRSRCVNWFAMINPSELITININPAWMNNLRFPERSLNAPMTGCKTAFTKPNKEMRIPTRTVSGNGNQGAGSVATYKGITMNRMLLPTASPNRAVESAITTRFPPLFSKNRRIINPIPLSVLQSKNASSFAEKNSSPPISITNKTSPHFIKVNTSLT